MMKTIAQSLVVMACLGLMPLVYAGPADDMKAALNDARTNLVSMLDATDKATQDGLHQKVTAASTAVDTALTAALADSSLAAAKVNEFKTVWEAFKATRETEIVPAIYAGKPADAKAVSQSTQAPRVKTMNGILTELGAK